MGLCGGWISRRQQEREAFLTALHSMVEVSVAASEAQREMAKSFQAYLELFKTTGEPQRYVTSDAEEWRKEQEREAQELADLASLPLIDRLRLGMQGLVPEE